MLNYVFLCAWFSKESGVQRRHFWISRYLCWSSRVRRRPAGWRTASPLYRQKDRCCRTGWYVLLPFTFFEDLFVLCSAMQNFCVTHELLCNTLISHWYKRIFFCTVSSILTNTSPSCVPGWSGQADRRNKLHSEAADRRARAVPGKNNTTLFFFFLIAQTTFNLGTRWYRNSKS